MSRPSTAESAPSTPRGILDTLRESKTAKAAAALGLSATLLAGCGKSGPEGWPENPCNVAEAAVPVSQEDGSDKGWICSTGGRNDGLTNEQAAGGNAANPANIPTAIDTPTTVTTPTSNPETLTPQERVDAGNAAAQNAYEYQVGGKTMSFEELQKYFEIPSNVTTPEIVLDLLEEHMNVVANAGNDKEEYETNRALADKARDEDKFVVLPTDIHSFYGDAFAASAVHPQIDAPNDAIGELIIPENLFRYTREFGSTRDNPQPFKVNYNLKYLEGAYLPANPDQFQPTPEMNIRVNFTRTLSGSKEESTIRNGTKTEEKLIRLVVLDGKWVVTQTADIVK